MSAHLFTNAKIVEGDSDEDNNICLSFIFNCASSMMRTS